MNMRHACLILALAGACLCPASGATLNVDLVSSGSAGAWFLPDGSGRVEHGELVLDGRGEPAVAFLQPHAWRDATLRARFLVEPASQGVLACGFMIRAQDADTYYAVHFDRGQAILIRSDEDNPWNEIKRLSGLEKPAGQWHEGAVQCAGDVITVSLNGKKLYEARDSRLTSGRVGFYASQGLVHIKDISITGEASTPPGKLVKLPPKFVYVCRDAGAGAYEAFPDVCRLGDGRLMCVFFAGYDHVSLPNEKHPLGGRVAFCTSSDEGVTWSPAGTLYDGPGDDRDPSIMQLPDGRLLCTFFTLDPRKTGGGYDCRGSMLTVSDDGGKSWAEPRLIAPDYYCSSPIRRLSTGRLMLGLYAQRGEEAWGAVTWSDDAGKTWSKPVDIPRADRPMAAETDVIELKDGSVYASLRCDSGPAGGSISRDQGKTWTAPDSTFRAHCPYLHRAPDGSILLAHRLPQTSLHVSRDECRTWAGPVQVDAHIGAYPSMVTLRDRSVLIVYYEEGPGSNIRARRMAVEEGKIRWLPVTREPAVSKPAAPTAAK